MILRCEVPDQHADGRQRDRPLRQPFEDHREHLAGASGVDAPARRRLRQAEAARAFPPSRLRLYNYGNTANDDFFSE